MAPPGQIESGAVSGITPPSAATAITSGVTRITDCRALQPPSHQRPRGDGRRDLGQGQSGQRSNGVLWPEIQRESEEQEAHEGPSVRSRNGGSAPPRMALRRWSNTLGASPARDARDRPVFERQLLVHLLPHLAAAAQRQQPDDRRVIDHHERKRDTRGASQRRSHLTAPLACAGDVDPVSLVDVVASSHARTARGRKHPCTPTPVQTTSCRRPGWRRHEGRRERHGAARHPTF